MMDNETDFDHLLKRIHDYYSCNGSSKLIKQKIEESECRLKLSKHKWVCLRTIYDAVCEQLYHSQPDKSNIRIHKLAADSFSHEESREYITCDPDPTRDSQLLGLTPQIMDECDPIQENQELFVDYVLPTLENKINSQLMNLNDFYTDQASDDSSNSHLCSIIETDLQNLQNYKQKISEVTNDLSQNADKYLQVINDCLKVLEKLISIHRLSQQTRHDNITSDWLSARCETMSLKLKLIEMRLLCETYNKEATKALTTIRKELVSAKTKISEELNTTSYSLKTYEFLGKDFEALVNEYQKLTESIENKKWALQDLELYSETS